jgi:hypothetical protein
MFGCLQEKKLEYRSGDYYSFFKNIFIKGFPPAGSLWEMEATSYIK